eukprot:TRINITY_DN987_c0_g3_i1.p1 TRINITY_DN987_c0_g3~~TRINITY_DN987_c0_g3_i1.p1  ORF type:complete len:238 (+),score=49.49 TRINITY_DN987_c0_g3_i1:30-743(+)
MSFQQFFNDIPPVTKVLFVGSIGATVLGALGFLNLGYFTLNFHYLIYKIQVWRIITNVFIYGLGLPFLMSMMLLYKFSSILEKEMFNGRTADYIWFILFGGFFLTLIGLWWPFAVLGKGLIFMMVYYWSRKTSQTVVQMMFRIEVKPIYFPWGLVAIRFLLGGVPILEIMGIFVGHLYFFLKDVVPYVYDKNLIKTPSFIYNLLPAHLNQNANNAPAPRNYNNIVFRGNGNRLGGNN